MAQATPLSLDEFRKQVLNRFRKPIPELGEDKLVAILDQGVFKEFEMVAEYCNQFRAIAKRLYDATPRNQDLTDLLAQYNDEVTELFKLFQDSILELPQAIVIDRKQK